MDIIRGKIQKAQRIVVYGPEGIGKSTFGSKFPNPLFIDTEGGSSHLDVARIARPSSWSMLRHNVTEFKRDPQGFKTLVIDTADWAQRLAVASVCAAHGLSSLGGQDDFGHSYNLLEEEWGSFLNQLDDVIEMGVHVVMLAHAKMRKFEQPEEAGAFDRWELKLEKKTAALLKEWGDLVLFVNYKTLVVEMKNKAKKGTGGARVMYATHHPCWDAKNRHDLPDEMPFDYSAIAHAIPQLTIKPADPLAQPSRQTQPVPTPPQDAAELKDALAAKMEADVAAPAEKVTPAEDVTSFPAALYDLMKAHNVSEADIQAVVSARGYYPEHTPIGNYDQKFIDGVLVAAWDQVHTMIKEMKGAA